MPHRLTIEMVYNSVQWLNMFPQNGGVSNKYSPRSIIIGMKVDHNKDCRIKFGSYAQVHEEHDNSMTTHTTGAIALCPTGNAQGSFFFLSLSTGQCLNRLKWTELPMPAEAIGRVHELACLGNADQGLLFTDRNRQLYADDGDAESNDETYDPNDDNSDNNSDDSDADSLSDDDNSKYDSDDADDASQDQIAGVTGNQQPTVGVHYAESRMKVLGE
jgi:hypothetical protein